MGYVSLCVTILAILGACATSASAKAEDTNCRRLTEPWQFTHLASTIPLWVTTSPEASLNNAPKALKAGLLRFMNEAKHCVFTIGRDGKQFDEVGKGTAIRMLSFFQTAFTGKEDKKVCLLHGLWSHDTPALLKLLDVLLDDSAAAMLSTGLASLGISSPDKLSLTLERECTSKEWHELSRQSAIEFAPNWRDASCEEAASRFSCLSGYLRRLDLASWACSAWWTREGGVADHLLESGRSAVKALAADMISRDCHTRDATIVARLVDGIRSEPGSYTIADRMAMFPKALTAEDKRSSWGSSASENTDAGGGRLNEKPSAEHMNEIAVTTNCVAAMRRGEQQTVKCEKLIRKHNADWWPIDGRGNYVDYFANS